MFLLEIENILTKVNLDVPKHLLLILFGQCFVKGGGGLKEVEVANQMPLSWAEAHNDGVKGGVGSGGTEGAVAEISNSGVWYCR